MKKAIATAFVAVVFSAGGAGIASAAAASPTPPPGGDTASVTFHCPHPRGTFTITADSWVRGQYEWYYGGLGCTHTP
ncbi:hypothetical protein [Streptomyces sp. NPDC101150]|uniref:hypothetical protein n=1 Tax=Streptomyces sp. NPDC101150 TaxID=3366114 RepID=UPI0037FEE961